jgi:hypothetical protein
MAYCLHRSPPSLQGLASVLQRRLLFQYMSSFVGQFDKYFVEAKGDSIYFDFGHWKVSAAFF